MEAKNLFNRLIDESFTKKYDITSILYQYVVHERKRNGQGDDNENKNLVSANFFLEYSLFFFLKIIQI